MEQKKKQNNLIYNNRISANYYGTKNSASYQGYQDISLSGTLGSSRTDYENLDIQSQGYSHKQKQGSVGLSVHTDNRFYNRKKMFVETDLDLNGSYGHYLYDNSAEEESLPYYYKQTTNQYSITGGLPLLVGIGRIEDVQDARLAVYILDDLKASGDIKRTPPAKRSWPFLNSLHRPRTNVFLMHG